MGSDRFKCHYFKVRHSGYGCQVACTSDGTKLAKLKWIHVRFIKWILFNNQETGCSCRRTRPLATTPGGASSRSDTLDAPGVLRHQTSHLAFQHSPDRTGSVGLAIAETVLHQDTGVQLLPEDGQKHRHRAGPCWSLPGSVNFFISGSKNWADVRSAVVTAGSWTKPMKISQAVAGEL